MTLTVFALDISAESAQFWRGAGGKIAAREILDTLSVTGGVPRYLKEVDPGLSAEENTRRLCFRPEGELYQDFDAIFNPVFGDATMFRRKILGILAEGPASGDEIARHLGVDRNGWLAERLRELSEGGFIDSNPGLNQETGKESRVSKYRLRDNYTRFYLKYVEPRKKLIKRGGYRFQSLAALRSLIGMEEKTASQASSSPPLDTMLHLISSKPFGCAW